MRRNRESQFHEGRFVRNMHDGTGPNNISPVLIHDRTLLGLWGEASRNERGQWSPMRRNCNHRVEWEFRELRELLKLNDVFSNDIKLEYII